MDLSPFNRLTKKLLECNHVVSVQPQTHILR